MGGAGGLGGAIPSQQKFFGRNKKILPIPVDMNFVLKTREKNIFRFFDHKIPTQQQTQQFSLFPVFIGFSQFEPTQLQHNYFVVFVLSFLFIY